MLMGKSRLVKRSLLRKMVEIKEHIEHEEIGEIKALKDDVKEDIEEALREKEVIETTTGD